MTNLIKRVGTAAAVLMMTMGTLVSAYAETPQLQGTTTTANPKHAGTLQIDLRTGTSTWLGDDLAAQQDHEANKGAPIDVYANTTTSTSDTTGDSMLDSVYGDRLATTGRGTLNELAFTIFNWPGGGPLITATYEVCLYDAGDWPTYPSGYPDTQLGCFTASANFGAGLEPGFFATLTATGLEGQGIELHGQDILVTQQMIEYTGTPSHAAIVVFNPPTVGVSDGSFFASNSLNPPGMYSAAFDVNLGFRVNVNECDPVSDFVLELLVASVGLGGTDSFLVGVGNDSPCAALEWEFFEDPEGTGDCSWLEIVSAAGSTGPLGFTEVNFRFDAFGLAPGTYSCPLRLVTNDPATPVWDFEARLIVAGEVANAAPGTIYATQGFVGTGEFVTIDPATGAATSLGTTRVAGMPGLAINSVGEIYGIGSVGPGAEQILYRIDANSGAVVAIGSSGNDQFLAMAFGTDDVLYGIAAPGNTLVTIDTATGAVTPGPTVTINTPAMAFDPTDGTLFVIRAEVFPVELHTIDIVSGAETLVGAISSGDRIGDIHFDSSGRLYGVTGGGGAPNAYVAIDKTSGVTTAIGPTGIDVLTGLAMAPSVPTITLSPPTLSFNAELGNAFTNEFLISNAPGAAPLEWSVTVGGPGGECGWLGLISPASGTTAAGGTEFLDIFIDAFGLAPGLYECTLEVASNDPNNPVATLPVSLEVTGTVARATPGVVYATQGYAGTRQLLQIDPLTGVATELGDTRVQGLPGLAINSQGEMYVAGGATSSEQDLFRIDALDGAVVRIGSTGVTCFQAMAFAADDVLYGIGTCGQDTLYIVDTATGAVTRTAIVDGDIVGMDFDPTDGTLYGVEWNGGLGLDDLYTIDTTTGATTFVGSLGFGVGIGDIHFDAAGNLFGVIGGGAGDNSYVAIDKATGVGTLIGATGIPAITGLTLLADPAAPVPDTPVLPSAFALHAATPNPFNPMTRISFEMPASGHVTVDVYDSAGRRIKTIFDGVKSAGMHEVTFSADRLASGMYFYEMRTGGFREIRKMTLLK